MRALITNDDGIRASGLAALVAAAVDAGLDVSVAAPQEESSGSSASLSAVGADGRILVDRCDDFPVPALAVGASPAFIVFTACQGGFGDLPDLVLAGVNHGPNLGHAVAHSGTVGAALTGALHGRRGLAVSTEVDDHPDWAAIAAATRPAIDALLASPEGSLLNVNIPSRGAPNGYRRAKLAPFGAVQAAIAEEGTDFVRVDVEPIGADAAPGTDVALLDEGFATVTPLAPVSEPVDPELDRVLAEAFG
jgi:5'-nucleotidase